MKTEDIKKYEAQRESREEEREYNLMNHREQAIYRQYRVHFESARVFRLLVAKMGEAKFFAFLAAFAKDAQASGANEIAEYFENNTISGIDGPYTAMCIRDNFIFGRKW